MPQPALISAAVAGLFAAHFVLIGRANDIVLGPHGGSWSAHLVLTAWAQVKSACGGR